MIMAQALRSPISFFRVTLSLEEEFAARSLLSLSPIVSVLLNGLPARLGPVQLSRTEPRERFPGSPYEHLGCAEEDVRMRTAHHAPFHLQPCL